jgi:hypothetical protein
VAGTQLSIGDLSFQPSTGVLFGISSNTFSTGGILYTINIANGSATVVGNTGSGVGGGLAFAPNGTLYHTVTNASSQHRINVISPVNGTLISGVAVGTFYDGLGVRPSDGIVFASVGGANDSVHTVNPATGASTLIGNTGQGALSDVDFRRNSSITTVSYTGPAVAIPDAVPAGVNLTLPVAGIAGQITDINFRFDGTAPPPATNAAVDHTFVGDLKFTLTAPNGTTSSVFFDRPGVPVTTFGCAEDNIFNLLIDDEGMAPVENACSAGMQGTFTPNNPLSVFDGLSPNGAWTLNASDNAGSDTGSIRSFSLVINSTGACVPVVSGSVLYENAAVPPVGIGGVNLNAPGSPAVNGATAINGSYSLSGFGPSTPYTVTPTRPNVVSTASNGIFANDAALISRHVVGQITLTPSQLAAGKVSGGMDLSSFDAGLVARWIVGLSDMINQTGQWKFTPANRMYPNVDNIQTGQNYTGLLMGDVSGDWTPSLTRFPALSSHTLPWNSVLVSAPPVGASPGSTVIVPIRIDNLEGRSVSAFQFDIQYDPKVISPAMVAASLEGTLAGNLTIVSNSPEPGLLKIVVYGAIPAAGDGVYANLAFTATASRGASTPVNITNIRINDGERTITAAAGRVTIR